MTTTVPPSEALRVELGSRSYDILVGDGLIASAGRSIAPLLSQSRVVVVTDRDVARHWLEPLQTALRDAGIESDVVTLDPGEQTKDFDHLRLVVEHLLDLRVERSTMLIALGGGVIGDLTGLAAAITLRGLGYIQIPTTLLSQVDSSVGGKTAIDTRHGKNLVGAFFQPRLVIADIAALETLPARQLRAGYAEVVKYGLINDPAFFAWIERHGRQLLDGDRGTRRQAVLTSCKSKAAIVAADECETGERALLNLGHTFGHALEAETAYADVLLHGEAVAIGMVLAFDFSVRLGLCPPEDADRVRRHLAAMGLPTRASAIDRRTWSADDVVRRMEQDKKARNGKLTLVLTHGIGKSFVARDADRNKVRDFLTAALSE